MNSGQHQCPVWTVYNTTSQQCECCKTDSLIAVVECRMYNQSSVNVGLRPCYCLSQYTNESTSAVVSNCPFSCSKVVGVFRDIDITSTVDDPICSQFKRRGPMCGLCEHNNTPSVYSYNFTCVECTDYGLNWLKYIAIAFLPLTVFYILVLVLKISATAGSMNALITIIQLWSSSGIVRFHYASYRGRIVEKYCNWCPLHCESRFFRALVPSILLAPIHDYHSSILTGVFSGCVSTAASCNHILLSETT